MGHLFHSVELKLLEVVLPPLAAIVATQVLVLLQRLLKRVNLQLTADQDAQIKRIVIEAISRAYEFARRDPAMTNEAKRAMAAAEIQQALPNHSEQQVSDLIDRHLPEARAKAHPVPSTPGTFGRAVPMLILAVVLAGGLLGAARPAAAQAFPTAGERKAADIASWATLGVALYVDGDAYTKGCSGEECLRELGLIGVRLAATGAAVYALKRIVHKARPCAPSCGSDAANQSFPSGHTAFAFSTLGGARWFVSVPLAVSTGGLRVAAGKHDWVDILGGAAIGALTSRIR